MTLRTLFRAEHLAWLNALSRCYNTASDSYDRYGGAGVQVDPAWHGHDGFFRFLDHLGPRPSAEHSLDRIDGQGHYQPGNVRWATRTEQSRNRCNVVIPGEVLDTLAIVSEQSGVPIGRLRDRYRKSGKIDTSPVRPSKPRRKSLERRARTMKLLEQGLTQKAIAADLGVSEQAVRLMIIRARKEGWGL